LASDTLTITDNRTGKNYELPISDGTIKALDLRKIKVDDDDFGLMTYDPAFMNTASCRSEITFIDGDKGILEYRGYPIEQLAEKSTYLETAYLLLHGELPTKEELTEWEYDVTHHTILNENFRKLIDSFRYDAHPMGRLISSVATLGTIYPESKEIFNLDIRRPSRRSTTATPSGCRTRIRTTTSRTPATS
jgi:citrate synthase